MGSKRGVSVDPARQRERKNKNTMYVIVEIQGQQFKVENGKKLFVHYLGAEHGAVLEFDKVLLVDKRRSCNRGHTHPWKVRKSCVRSFRTTVSVKKAS